MKVSNDYVGNMLRKDFGMRYKKIKTQAFQGNSQRSLVLR